MVLYDYDNNATMSKTVKNRQAATIYDAFLNIHNIIKSRGSNQKSYMMENECSRDLKEYMKKYDIDFQLYPPRMHRRNAAEREIRASKNSFISGLSTAHPASPIIEWDQLLP